MWDEIIGDEVIRDVLSALYFLGEATPYELSKVTGHNSATIIRRLNELVKKGIIEEPIEDTSTGRLRKIYKAPSEDFYNNFRYYLRESFRGREAELNNFMLNELFRIFDLPHRIERDVEDVLRTCKNPTWILLGIDLGYWKLEDNKLVVTDEAINLLKKLYCEAIERNFYPLVLLDPELAHKLWEYLGEKYIKPLLKENRLS